MNHPPSLLEKSLAWGVHVFTASGLLAGFMAMLAVNGKDFRLAMAWLLIALLIDGVDGTFARKFRTKQVLPKISGKTMDYIIDFANYAIVPAYFFYMAELVTPVWNLPLTFLILLVSAIYYGINGMVSDDYYFIGFPVMWNVVVFYLVFIFDLSAAGNAVLIVFFSVLHFVPVKFAYPSRAIRLKRITLIFTVIIMCVMPLAVWFYPEVPVWVKWAAVGSLAYFGILAVIDTFGKSGVTGERLKK
jgi:phosphatidylcholine synthase